MANGSQLLLSDIGYQASLPTIVMPDMGDSGIFLKVFPRDTCHRRAGMTKGGWIPANHLRGEWRLVIRALLLMAEPAGDAEVFAGRFDKVGGGK